MAESDLDYDCDHSSDKKVPDSASLMSCGEVEQEREKEMRERWPTSCAEREELEQT